MNIALLTSDFLPNVGGMATHVHELAKVLAHKNHLVHIVNPVYLESSWIRLDIPSEKDTDDFVEQFDNIVVHRLFIKKNTAHVKHLHYIANTRSYLLNLRKDQRINILHWHDFTPNCWTTRLVKKHFPLVWTNHTSNYLEYYETILGRIKIRAYLHHPDAIISPSKELNEKSIKTGVKKEWLYYIPNGVDTNKFSPHISSPKGMSECPNGFLRKTPVEDTQNGIEKKYGLDPDKIIIICPRRLEPKNGVEYFIKAIPLVRQSFPETQFLIVGGGFPDEKKRFELFLKQNNEDAGVVFTDNVPNTLMPGFYAASDIAVLPSLMEATSISGLEAMSSGLPLIGTNIGGIPEIIEHEVSGILIEPRNPQAIAVQIKRIIQDDELRVRLGSAARKRVEEHFSWDVIADRTLEVYERVLAKRKRHS